MNLASLSIQRSRLTWMVLLAVVGAGLLTYGSLARDSMPPYTVRVASVVTRFPGASPERVELLVTDKVEKIAQELPELDEVTSTSRTGLSVVSVTLRDEIGPGDLQAVWDRLRRKLEQMEDLPAGVEPSLNDEGIGEVFGMVVGLTSDGFSYAEMKEYADDLRDDLIKLRNAAKVELGGVQEERVFVEFDNARLREYNLTAGILQNILAATNILGSGGAVNLEEERVILEPTGNFDDIEGLRSLLIPVGRGQLVQLEDIATVRRGYVDPPTQLVRVDGREAITLHVSLKSGANIILLGEEVDALLADWESRLPIGLDARRVASLDLYIQEKIDSFLGNLLQAIVVVLGVMLVFMGLRTGFVIASLIPIVTVMTLMLMGVLDIGLNQVTLAALIMALGMMVDNAIVVAEAIVVKIDDGIDAKQAAISACGELFAPLLISTLTTSAAFLAFYMSPTVMGDIVGPIFVVISLALLSSWLVALTITTMFCYLFLGARREDERPGLVDRAIAWLRLRYRAAILAALARRGRVVGGIVVAFVLAIVGFGLVPFVFFPDSDRNTVTVDISLPLGTRIERTDEVVAQFESFLRDSLLVTDRDRPGVLGWTSFVGEGPESYDLGYNPDEANSSYAHLLITTSGFEFNREVIDRLYTFGFDGFPNAEITVGSLDAGGGGVPIEIKVSGDDPDELARISERIRQAVVNAPGTVNVKDDWGPKSKKFVVAIDQSVAQAAGVTSQDIAVSLRTILEGIETGEFREDDKSIPILMRDDASQQQTLMSLETMDVFAQSTGRSVPLLQVARIVPEWQYSRIRRLDLRRTVVISSELATGANAAAVTSAITPVLDEMAADWPPGYSYQLGGDAQNTAENMGAVYRYLPLSGLIILFLLIVQFNSIRKTAMVVATIPLAIIGVVIGLLVFREEFGFMPFLGVISLAGIVINNAIVLLDRVEIEQSELGRTPQDAVIAACLQRFRPILLATFTTVLGLLPLYLSGGEMWEGMAIAIMIGLLFGTVITLVFIPSVYSLLFRVDYRDYEFDEARIA
ncbi:MAG: efflux RND transporter permease subunit [Gemmatimonadetes bacterium]|nr:efflux RND transporter permease subunit [Gemmatimonadota bacterium]